MQTEPISLITGTLLCTAALLRTVYGIHALLRNRRQQVQQADLDAEGFRQEAQALAAATKARLSQGLAWEGRKRLRISGIVEESDDIKSFYLTSPEGRPLPLYLPGQYITVALQTSQGSEPVVRCYTLSDRPRSDYYRITVKRLEAPVDKPSAPPGAASNWLHDHVKVGDQILCEAPKGAFFHDSQSTQPVVLIGAGVGVTPIISMLAALDQKRFQGQVYVMLGYQNGKHGLFREQLEQIAERNPSFSIRLAYSRPEPEDVLGSHYHHEGRISFDWLSDLLPSNNFEFFLCGPPRMMQSLVPDLLIWGAPDDAIHYEAFGPASVSLEASPDALERAKGSQVFFAGSDKPVEWDGAHSTLLELAEACGVPVSSGCRAGNCGACRMRVIDGSITPLKRPGSPLDEQECLACISVPDGKVSLET